LHSFIFLNNKAHHFLSRTSAKKLEQAPLSTGFVQRGDKQPPLAMILMFSPLPSDSRLWVNQYFQLYLSTGNKKQQQCFQNEEKQANVCASVLFKYKFLSLVGFSSTWQQLW